MMKISRFNKINQFDGRNDQLQCSTHGGFGQVVGCQPGICSTVVHKAEGFVSAPTFLGAPRRLFAPCGTLGRRALSG